MFGWFLRPRGLAETARPPRGQWSFEATDAAHVADRDVAEGGPALSVTRAPRLTARHRSSYTSETQ